MNAFGRFAKAAQAALRTFRHSGVAGFVGGLLRRTRIDYRKEVGDLMDASVVMAPVQWVQRALPEAVLKVSRKNSKGEIEEISDHGMLALIQNPNPFYADIVLWWGVVLSLLLDGNAYWMIVRNGVGRPAQLWYIPHWMLEPKWPEDGSEFISHYRYSPGGGAAATDVAPEDVIHFRYGIDPRNMRKGLSPIYGVIREIFMDIESSNFVAALLKNMGVPGIVIAPKGGAMPNPADVEATKTYVAAQFGGDGRGRPLVLGAPTEVSQFGFNPQQMEMSGARDVAEERVCAGIGIPAAVVGFGAGLQTTKVGATMGEMRKLAWENGVLPIGKLIADELKRSLLPLFGNPAGLDVFFDTSEVPAMQEDEDKRTDRWNKMLQTGGITVYTWRIGLGLDADDSHKYYLRGINMIEVPEGGARPDRSDPATDRGAKSADSHAAHDHAPGDHAPRATPDRYKRAAAYATMLQNQESGLADGFETRLIGFFGELADGARTAARPLLEEQLGKSRGVKSDDLLVDMILDELGIPKWASQLRRLYEAHYAEVGDASGEAAEAAGLGKSMPDRVAQSIIAAGGRRAGIVDLQGQTRAAMFDAIAEGRAAGEGAEAIAGRIYPLVAAGASSDPEIRARRIARTETKYAQNISTIERGKAAGVTRFVVFDGRLGPGRSKLDHIARDGSIVGAARAVQMAEEEHPNGTLSFGPHFDEEDE
ncbi:phage portal protein [Sphingopyxis macrogoltabida]|uniref:Portal protein n=1 Tax=Sphingopyxis macrogoltabida TaxID=33050 RepID=A0AAC8Z2B3_SPHMC|nr:phage portal protein [Sphingopyxis macrogoltabida]ALJ14257.1 phage portal protein [Sphingopyxis macrogoltabida]AMU90522.1 portal protein [Sphingopyxis macrogoltabida]